MKVEIYDSNRTVWYGKLDQIPRVGDEIVINNKTLFGKFTVLTVSWLPDRKRVNIKVSDGE